jgi:phage terminase large subunit
MYVLKNIAQEDLLPLCDIHIQDMRIVLPNKSIIYVDGTEDNIRLEKLLGREFSTIFLDEVSQTSYQTYTILQTRLSQKNELKKLLLLTENPPHMGHWTHKVFFEGINPTTKLPISLDDKVAIKMNPVDNVENIGAGYIESLENNLDTNSKERFLYGNFVDVVENAVYGEELQRAKKEERIRDRISVQEGYDIKAVFDIGMADSTAIWTIQYVQDKIFFLDYYENQNESLEHYIKYLSTNGYKYSQLILPHDARNKWWGNGNTIYGMAYNAAKKNNWLLKVLPQASLIDGINAAKGMWRRCYFNKSKCEKGLEALRNYKYDFNESLNVSNPTPIHDWASHGCDAFRYACLSYTYSQKKVPKVPQDPTKFYVEEAVDKPCGYNATLHPEVDRWFGEFKESLLDKLKEELN